MPRLAAILLVCLTMPVSADILKSSDRTGWRMVWSDEFNSNGRPDPKKWTFETGGGGWGNYEHQYYTDRAENSRVEDGHMVIEVRKEPIQDHHYTSARVTTVPTGGWRYGRFEVRAKLPSGAGTWPALWFMPIHMGYGNQGWPDNGEIDMMEHIGADPEHVLGAFYTKNSNWMNGNGLIGYHKVPNLETDFNVFAMEWTENEASLFVNDHKFLTLLNPRTTWMDWPFDKEFYLIMNIALGGFGGEIDDSIFPQKMLIDYVRIYERIPGAPQETAPTYLSRDLILEMFPGRLTI